MDTIDALNVKLSPDVREVADELIDIRRHIHRHPELGFMESDTQKLVLKKLAEWGIEGKRLGGTGVIADIVGRKPGPVLLVRGDMDALPIQELGETPYKSTNDGVMHACGHDAHTAMILVTARLLKRRGLDKGTVRFMFQPAEEGQGGAAKMIEEGVLSAPTVDAAIGFHVWSGFEIGHIAILDGATAASVDGFKLTIRGRGTHAATPEDGVDPVLIAAQIITAAQSLVTRRIAPQQPVVLSFTAVHAGTAFNIIPETAEILGTFRTLDTAVRERLRNDLRNLAESIARTFEADCTYETIVENIPTLNHPDHVATARAAAEAVVGRERLITPSSPMVGEDFSEVLNRVPGVFVFVGCGNETKGITYPHHHPLFDIDERVLPIGVETALGFIDRLMHRL